MTLCSKQKSKAVFWTKSWEARQTVHGEKVNTHHRKSGDSVLVLMVKTWEEKPSELLMRLLYWCRQGEANVITSFVKHSTLTDKQDVPFLHNSQRIIIKQNNWKWQNYYKKLLDNIFFLGSIFCLSPSQEDSRFIKSLAKGHFSCHPLHLEVIISSNIISFLAYKQQDCAIENLNQEIWGKGLCWKCVVLNSAIEKISKWTLLFHLK